MDNAGFTVDAGQIGGMYGVFDTSSSGDGHILLKRNGTNEYQVGVDTSQSYFIYNYNTSSMGFQMSATGNKLFLNGEGGTSYNLYANAAATTAFALRLDGVGTGSSNLCQFVNGNGQVGSITLSGVSTAYNTSSDYRLKENVTDITDGITRVKQLSPKKFNWISDETDTLIDGFLAHEAQTVVPEAVTGTHNELEVWLVDEELPEGVSVGDNKLDDDGNTIPKYQGIDQAKLVPLLTAALQEAITKIEDLETRITTLENA